MCSSETVMCIIVPTAILVLLGMVQILDPWAISNW